MGRSSPNKQAQRQMFHILSTGNLSIGATTFSASATSGHYINGLPWALVNGMQLSFVAGANSQSVTITNINGSTVTFTPALTFAQANTIPISVG